MQVGYLANFIRTLDWWNLRPATALLAEQPGDKEPAKFIAVSQSVDGKTILVYQPKANPVKLYNLYNLHYEAVYFNPVTNQTAKGNVNTNNGILTIMPPEGKNDFVLVLKRKN